MRPMKISLAMKARAKKPRQIITAEMNQARWCSLQPGAQGSLSVADGPSLVSDVSTLRLFHENSDSLSPCDGCLPSS